MSTSANGIALILPEALLYDSEASLRLVDNALEELHVSEPDPSERLRGLVEQIDAAGAGRGELMASLRQELNGITHRLQLEDVTSEQLGHIASLLHRVTEVMAGIPHTGSSVGSPQHDV
jgi:formate-dependent nitrite reductase cytochrome c552 subunit